MAAGERPDEAEIRRVLAELMTASDIDDAMGWPPGTARRRRWRSLERGGLPASDAELGGVAIWFRSTLDEWQRSRSGRSGRASRAPLDEPRPAADDAGQDEEPDLTVEAAQPSGLAPASQDADPPEEPLEVGDAVQDVELGNEEEVEPDQQHAPEVEDDAGDEELDDAGDDGSVESGFELERGQHVLAHVHGEWRKAQVGHRDRHTVVVDYHVDDTALGARRQRISVERVRVQPVD